MEAAHGPPLSNCEKFSSLIKGQGPQPRTPPKRATPPRDYTQRPDTQHTRGLVVSRPLGRVGAPTPRPQPTPLPGRRHAPAQGRGESRHDTVSAYVRVPCLPAAASTQARKYKGSTFATCRIHTRPPRSLFSCAHARCASSAMALCFFAFQVPCARADAGGVLRVVSYADRPASGSAVL